jgi:hypothetical protein
MPSVPVLLRVHVVRVLTRVLCLGQLRGGTVGAPLHGCGGVNGQTATLRGFPTLAAATRWAVLSATMARSMMAE